MAAEVKPAPTDRVQEARLKAIEGLAARIGYKNPVDGLISADLVRAFAELCKEAINHPAAGVDLETLLLRIKSVEARWPGGSLSRRRPEQGLRMGP
jgi:hypothetical protein